MNNSLHLVEKCAIHKPIEEIDSIKPNLRGIYVLYKYRRRSNKYDVVYVGMAAAGNRRGIKGRLSRHRDKKAGLWTHFSVYKVWDNIPDQEVEELEGLFRYIYRKDSKANKLNKQRGYAKLKKIKINNFSKW